MPAYMKFDGVDGESANYAPDEDIIVHRVLVADDYFDPAPVERDPAEEVTLNVGKIEAETTDTQATEDEFVFFRWSASDDRTIGVDLVAASGDTDGSDGLDIIGGSVAQDGGRTTTDADLHVAVDEIVICADMNGITLCDIL